MQKSYLALCIALAVPSTYAADTQNNDLERIVITGSRIIESIDEVPASITVIDNQAIQEQMLVTSELQNILAIKVPGMSASTGTSSNFGQTLRGRSALVMIDGVPQSTPLRSGSLGIRTLDPSTIERIEVIKGATSVYGNGAAGGIINYITKKASNKNANVSLDLSSKASAVKYEDSQGYRIGASVDGTAEQLSYVLSATQEKTGVQRDAEGDIIGLKYGLSEMTSKNLFTKLGYRFDEEKSLQLTYNYYEAQQDADYMDVVGSVNGGVKTYAIKVPEGTDTPGVPQGPRGNHNLMLKYVDDLVFANSQLTVDAYTQEIENIFFYSTVLANPDEGFDGGQSYIKSDKTGLRAVFNTQLEWQDMEGTFIYGADLLNDVTSQPMVDGRIWVPEMDMNNVAFFLQSKWILADDWVIKAGVRNEEIDLQVDDYDTLKLCRDADTCSVPMAVTGGDLNYKATTYNLGLRYIGNELFSPFLNYSQGADISDLGRLLRTATVSDINLIQTEASIIDNYEIGFSSQWDDLFFTFAAFESTSELGTSNKYDEKTGVYMPVRAPQEIWGYEATADYQWTDSLTVGATYGWTEGKDTEKDVYLGGKQISAPKLTGYLSWQPTGQSKLSVTYLHVGDRSRFEPVDGKYVGDQGPIESYDVVNLSGHYQWDNTTFFVGVENLFNEDYYSARSQALTYSGYNTKGLGTTLNMGVTMNF